MAKLVKWVTVMIENVPPIKNAFHQQQVTANVRKGLFQRKTRSSVKILMNARKFMIVTQIQLVITQKEAIQWCFT